MKALWIMIVAVSICSCSKKSDVEYKVDITGNGFVDTLMYTDENGSMITNTNVSSSFSKTFSQKKGFRSYLYVSGDFSGAGSVNISHTVSDRRGNEDYRLKKYYTANTIDPFHYSAEGDHKIK